MGLELLLEQPMKVGRIAREALILLQANGQNNFVCTGGSARVCWGLGLLRLTDIF